MATQRSAEMAAQRNALRAVPKTIARAGALSSVATAAKRVLLL